MTKILSIITLFFLFFFTTSVASVVAAINYTYDANGNMTSDGMRCFEYDDANQLKKVKSCANNQTIAEYLYDHNGKRLVKKEYENGTLKQTIYSPSDEYETKKLPNGTTENTTYFKVNDEVVAKKNPDGSLNYFHNDHLGSTSVLTNQSGQVVEETAYEPYGEVKTGGTKSKWGYTGQEKDNETGLNYYDARYYDPHIHRFIQPDTLLPNAYDPQQLNRYAYARNNPLKYTDPTGHFSTLINFVINSSTSYISKLVSPPAPKPISKANLPSNLVRTSVDLPNKNGNLPIAYTKESPIANYVNESLSKGHIDVGVSYSIGMQANVGGGYKFANSERTQYITGAVGAEVIKGYRVGGAILMSNKPVKEHTFSTNLNVSTGIAAQMSFDPVKPFDVDKWEVGGFGIGCCGIDISEEWTGKTYVHEPAYVPAVYSKDLNEIYGK